MPSNASNPWRSGGMPSLNVAATCAVTKSLGPGWRAVIWVQGCPLRCPGCIAPGWIPYQRARLVSPEALADELLARPEVTGLTFSGGEPMVQAAGLAAVIRYARKYRDLSLICFTGTLLEQLYTHPPGPGVQDLLKEIDVLIDGPYIARLNDNRGMRGSSNQRIHYLTERLRFASSELESGMRQAEIHVQEGEALLVGVPPTGLAEGFHRIIAEATHNVLSNSSNHPELNLKGEDL